jgi:hypothetical protein
MSRSAAFSMCGLPVSPKPALVLMVSVKAPLELAMCFSFIAGHLVD